MEVVLTQQLAGKVALVTGAAEGVGKAVAQRFITEGAKVVLTDVQVDKGEALAESLGENALFIKHDVTSEADWQMAVDKAVAHFGKLQILVNNAGISVAGFIDEASFDHWRQTQAVNSDSVFLGCRYAIPEMRKYPPGAIVNVTSALAVKAHAAMPAYSASKAAVRQVTKSIALRCAREGYDIRCNAVAPGSVMTPMQHRVLEARGGDKDEQLKTTIAQHPMGRIADPEEVANAVLFLASNESSFITGVEIPVDGGLTL